jgi:hypothetical protein
MTANSWLVNIMTVVRLAGMPDPYATVRKNSPKTRPDLYATEAAGLDWIAVRLWQRVRR